MSRTKHYLIQFYFICVALLASQSSFTETNETYGNEYEMGKMCTYQKATIISTRQTSAPHSSPAGGSVTQAAYNAKFVV